MSLPGCPKCQHLAENVSLMSARRLKIKLLLDTTVKKSPDDTSVVSLLRAKNSCELACREAIDQYRIHLLGHQTKTAVAALAA